MPKNQERSKTLPPKNTFPKKNTAGRNFLRGLVRSCFDRNVCTSQGLLGRTSGVQLMAKKEHVSANRLDVNVSVPPRKPNKISLTPRSRVTFQSDIYWCKNILRLSCPRIPSTADHGHDRVVAPGTVCVWGRGRGGGLFFLILSFMKRVQL